MNIPNDPGCYLFKDSKEKIIYIGKAKNLRKRVASYFNRKDLDEKTKNLIKNIKSTEFIVTTNEVEALILESNLIKKNQPKYNINLKDSKRYAYVEITNEDFPRIVIARKVLDGKYYGPFVSATEREYVVQLLRKVFMLRTCRKMPKRPCLRYHIGLCDAPCAKLISSSHYKDKIRKVEMVLKGKNKELIEKLKIEMKKYSKDKNFEKAITLREQINAIKYLSERQTVERQKRYDEDVLNYKVSKGKAYLMLFNIYKGVLANKNDFVFSYTDNFLEDFLIQYYGENKVKKELIIDKIDDSLKEFLLKKNVKIVMPKQGEKKKLLDLVLKNIDITYFNDKLSELRDKLKLNDLPEVIECFDISHLSGTSTVGSMVQFRNGIPDKSNYRRFKIRSVLGIDDFKAINEVVFRRYSRLKREGGDFPNLIIIDGGKGQLSSALLALSKLELKIPIISIAKKLEEIYFPGISYPIRLKEKDKALLFIRGIRDEAHRFAIKYNRLLRGKAI